MCITEPRILKKQSSSRLSAEKDESSLSSSSSSSPSNTIHLSALSIAVIMIASMTAAFGAGRFLAAQGLVVPFSTTTMAFWMTKSSHIPHHVANDDDHIDTVHLIKAQDLIERERAQPVLPQPPLLKGKAAPYTRYTYKYFDSHVKVRSSSALLRDTPMAATTSSNNTSDDDHAIANENDNSGTNHTNVECEIDDTGHQHCEKVNAATLASETPMHHDNEEEEEEIHHPAGQHLLVDIKNVQAAFLDSEERLATAMIDVVKQSELTLLSYHCHGLIPEGVSCVGVLLESHVSFHTWPSEGVITLDLFTCGSKSLLPLVNDILRLFGVPREEEEEEEEDQQHQYQLPHMVWSHKRRGFRYDEEHAALSDLDRFLGDVELGKEEIDSAVSDIQKVDIYDMVEPRFRDMETYQRSLDKSGATYEAQHPELFQKDRLVFLDGVLQSRRYGEAAYHEALVHPAMMTHEEPEKVVVVGAGTGAALREVLKHKTVREVVMLEVDEKVTEMSRKHLKEYSDCSEFSQVISCFDDPRVQMHHMDAVDWFIQNFLDSSTLSEESLYDVVLIDAFDPNTDREYTSLIFDNPDFVQALYNSLGEQGIIAVQIGDAESIGSAPDTFLDDGQVSQFIENIEEADFGSVVEYEEMHGRLQTPWRYLVGMKEIENRARWMQTEAEVNLQLHKRILRAVDGDLPLRHFDGASMMSYSLPSKVAEIRFCKTHPQACVAESRPVEQGGYDPFTKNHPVSSFQVGVSSSVGGGRGIFSKVDIANGDYLGLEEGVNGMHISSLTHSLIFDMLEKFPDEGGFWDVFGEGYINGYGFQDSFFGVPCAGVDSGIFTFANHGCDRSYNFGVITAQTEATVQSGADPHTIYDDRPDVYNPLHERNYFTFDQEGMRSIRDIKAGEELLDNYLIYGGCHDQEDFDENLMELKNMCSGLPGSVSSYEFKNSSAEEA